MLINVAISGPRPGSTCGDENPIRTLEDYSKPSHEGYRNTIELPEGKNVVPLRSDTIRLVQNECIFHIVRSEDPNQHLKDFLKLVDSLDIDVPSPRGRILLLVSLLNSFHQEGLQNFEMTSLCSNNIKESLSEAWTRFKDLLHKVPYHGIDLWLQVQIFYDHVNLATRRTISQSTSAHLAPKQHVQVNIITSSCEICSGPYDPQYCMENPKQAFVEYASSRTDEAGGLLEETDHVFRLADGTKSYLIRIVRDVEVHIGRLKLLNDFYIIDMKKDPETPLQVGRGFLATANAVIDCKKTKIAVGEGITRSVFGVK
uniref:Zinc finger, CCHC-type n=1 Tax=Tanacetum cinerariifolium TaxID=118510 RepID=A0A6L2MJR5_TANCI|nr:zinc finger, CCHC-type [Tanacetum cinerariifolium]